MTFQSLITWPCATTIFCTAIGLAILLIVYNKLTRGVFRSDKRLDGQVIIVTGSNTGIGKATALDFAKRGAKVILACRNLKKAEKARDEIVKLSNNKNVVVRYLDLTSLSSVRRFADEIKTTENRLDVLVNNAGAGGLGSTKSEDGIQLGMQVNHFGPFLLTYLLIDLLKKSAPSRIVHVSSTVHQFGKIDFDKFNSADGFFDFFVYCNSKLCNVICSNEFARRLKGTGVTSNSLHPGVVKTEIFNTLPRFAFLVVDAIMTIFAKTPEEGAQTSIFLAVSDDVAEVTGKYFAECKETRPSKSATDPELARKFWDKCCDLVQLQPKERSL